MKKKKVLIAASTFCELSKIPLKLLKKNNFDIIKNNFQRRLKANEIIKMGKNVDGIIAGLETYNYKVLKSLIKIKCISRVGVGVDNINQDYAKKNKIKILNTPKVVVEPVAQLTIGMLLNLSRKINIMNNSMKKKLWKKIYGNDITHKKIGIIGVGQIGKRVAEILLAFGAQLLLNDIKKNTKWAKKQNFKYVSLKHLIKNSDIILIHASNKMKREILRLSDIKMMKDGVILINCSRGKLINEKALEYGLKSKKISGLGLDVFNKEPYSGNLSKYNNVLLTPHIATFTKETRMQMELEATNNLIKSFKK